MSDAIKRLKKYADNIKKEFSKLYLPQEYIKIPHVNCQHNKCIVEFSETESRYLSNLSSPHYRIRQAKISSYGAVGDQKKRKIHM